MKKVLSLTLVIIMLAGMISGCSGSPSEPGSAPAASSSAAPSTATEAAGGEVSYPINTTETLTYWKQLNSVLVAPNYSSFNDTDFSKYVEEETGVHVQYISPPVGGEAEAFSLLVASGDMPDIIDYSWGMAIGGYPGGVQAALDNKIIIPLNDLLADNAPDLKAILDSDPNYDKMVKTDAGTYYIFPVMKLDNYLTTTAGLVVRWDWLDQLNLEKPVTMDDWYNMLLAFKNEMNADYPLTFPGMNSFKLHMTYGELIGAYGVTMGWYLQDDGKATFGPYNAGFKDWLREMAKWYREGLIDPNFATNDQAATDSNLLNNASGATALWLGSGLSKYLPALREIDEKATLGPVPYPVLNAGDTPQFSSQLNPYDGAGACITTSCKNPELAAQFLNYGYSEAGRKTYNYGREGISYEYDGQNQIQLTDAILKHEKNWPLGQAWSQFAHGVYPGPYFTERRYLEMYYTFDEQIKGLEYYTATNMRAHLLPPISPTTDESSEFARIMTDVQARVDEYTLTTILGTVDVDATFDAYINELKSMGMEDAIAIQEAALTRYYNR